MPHFNPDISLGSMISAVVFVFTLWQFHSANVKRFHRIEFKVTLMWKQFAHKFDLPEELEDGKD